VEARLFHAHEVGQLLDQATHQLAGDLDAGEVARRVVGENRQLDRAAQPGEIGMDRFQRRRPEIGRDGENAVGADLLRVPGKLHRVLDRERAHVDGDRDAAVDHTYGGFREQLALGDRQVERLALVVRPGDRGRAGANVEVEQPLEGRQIEAEVVLERRHRALHDASELVRHVVHSNRARAHKLPASAHRGKRVWASVSGQTCHGTLRGRLARRNVAQPKKASGANPGAIEGRIGMPDRVRSGACAVVTALAIAGIATQAHGQASAPTNSAPNPYRSVENWAKLPDGRSWGSPSGVCIDPAGTSVRAAERWGAFAPPSLIKPGTPFACDGSSLPPILKFDASGTLVKSFGAGLLLFPHGLTVDREGNVWVTDGLGKDGKGHQVFKFSPDGKVLLTLGKAGVAGDGPDEFNAPSAVVGAPNRDSFLPR